MYRGRLTAHDILDALKDMPHPRVEDRRTRPSIAWRQLPGTVYGWETTIRNGGWTTVALNALRTIAGREINFPPTSFCGGEAARSIRSAAVSFPHLFAWRIRWEQRCGRLPLFRSPADIRTSALVVDTWVAGFRMTHVQVSRLVHIEQSKDGPTPAALWLDANTTLKRGDRLSPSAFTEEAIRLRGRGRLFDSTF